MFAVNFTVHVSGTRAGKRVETKPELLHFKGSDFTHKGDTRLSFPYLN